MFCVQRMVVDAAGDLSTEGLRRHPQPSPPPQEELLEKAKRKNIIVYLGHRKWQNVRNYDAD